MSQKINTNEFLKNVRIGGLKLKKGNYNESSK